MSLPHCPQCTSDRVDPDQFSAGNNRCRACGHTGPVATFHTPVERPVVPRRGNKAPWPPAPAERPARPHRHAAPLPEPHEVHVRRWWDN